MSRHDPLSHIKHMLEYTREACDMARGHTLEELKTNRQLELALVRLMEIVGEAATRLSEDFKRRYPDVPWRPITALRNRLIHAYDLVDLDILWTIISQELSPLIGQLESILEKESNKLR